MVPGPAGRRRRCRCTHRRSGERAAPGGAELQGVEGLSATRRSGQHYHARLTDGLVQGREGLQGQVSRSVDVPVRLGKAGQRCRDDLYRVSLMIETEDQPGMLARLTEVIAKADSNITHIRARREPARASRHGALT
jgi:hypothetical protein